MLLRDGIKTHWRRLPFSALLDVASAVVDRAKAGPSWSDSCKDPGTGLDVVGGSWQVSTSPLPSPRGDRFPAPS